MKKKSFFAIYLMAATLAVATVSCKKDENKPATTGKNTAKEAYSPPRIDDMNAYLRDFKDMMRNPTRDGNVMLSLDEAAWHLSSVANYDFGNAVAEFDGIRFDTLYANVNLSGQLVSIADLGQAYADIASDIDAFFHSLDLYDRHFRFIGAEINNDGTVAISLITTYSTNTRWHYFADDDEAAAAYAYFPNANYSCWDAIFHLQNAINIEVGHNIGTNNGRIFYTLRRLKNFMCWDWHEAPGAYCPNIFGFMLFCTNGYFNAMISQDDMVYYLDSYLGLAYGNAVYNEEVICVLIENHIGGLNSSGKGATGGLDSQYLSHALDVTYGVATASNDNGY